MAHTDAHEAAYKELGVRLFTPPPVGFNPVTATDRELLVHGFPARPDGTTHPALLQRWKQAVSRPMTRIIPEFRKRTDHQHSPRRRLPHLANDTSTNWSGSVAFAAAGDAATYVAGNWSVPNVITPGSGNFYSSAWVGIDGDNSSDVLQAGTEQEIVNGAHHVYAWWEWYPDFEVQITNLPVSPGDIMSCVICVHSPTEAGFYLTNITTGVSTSFTKTAPSGTSLVGNCAEWIVEAPTVGGSQSALARYGDVYFDGCVAGTKKNALLQGGQGTPITMVNSSNKNISVPTLETAQLVKLQYQV